MLLAILTIVLIFHLLVTVSLAAVLKYLPSRKMSISFWGLVGKLLLGLALGYGMIIGWGLLKRFVSGENGGDIGRLLFGIPLLTVSVAFVVLLTKGVQKSR
ncbi:MAG: hypothetical protein DI539_22205 [Flavobacterium psychrophilum]|nr:MAG: hypothetical protein DI539_22205 [Flavobacterium psychrophilum]